MKDSIYPSLRFFFLLFSIVGSSLAWAGEADDRKQKTVTLIEETRPTKGLKGYFSDPENWGLELFQPRFRVNQTAEVRDGRVGHRFILQTPVGGFLWEYERAEGQGALFPRRNNVFSTLHKQKFKTGNQDTRSFGYLFDTKAMEEKGREFPIKLPFHIGVGFRFTDSDAFIGNKGARDSANERFESIETGFRVRLKEGRWKGAGADLKYIRHNPRYLGVFTTVTQIETIDRDIWMSKVTFPLKEWLYLSGVYDENNDVHKFANLDVDPTVFAPDRVVHSTRRKFGPEITYFFGKDRGRSATLGGFVFTGENAGSLAEYGLDRMFRVDAAGEFTSLHLHDSFSIKAGYEEKGRFGIDIEGGQLRSSDPSETFTGTAVVQRVRTRVLRDFHEELNVAFLKIDTRFGHLSRDAKDSYWKGLLDGGFSFWKMDNKGYGVSQVPVLAITTRTKNRDDRRITQYYLKYEFNKSYKGRSIFNSLKPDSIETDFGWDINTSDKLGGFAVGFSF